jgi:hypothetical protein
MADCNKLLKEFDSKIKLSSSRKEGLKTSRKDLRKKIRKYFVENKSDEIKPKFSGQGSMETDTSVNPIPRTIEENGEQKQLYKYDIDDGIYFLGDESEEKRKSVATYHTMIIEAVDGHTAKKPVDKNTCVRVIFSDGHNVDLPIYYKNGYTPKLAHKANGWMDSDPLEFIDWVEEKIKRNPQLCRIIRFFKAWSDYREFCNSSKKMPNGFILTILACDHYYNHEREDIAIKETLVNIQAELHQEFKCKRPTTPKGEDLLDEYSHRDYFLDELAKFIKNAKDGLKEENQKEACRYWQKIFGDRFSCSNAKDKNEKKQTGALATGAASSNPWTW